MPLVNISVNDHVLSMKKRSYTLRERAKSREETRLRIVEATMHLHEEIGPRATTISAIAERAGVQRLTVYRHFPDEMAVFQACTAHWLTLNPPPDPAAWADRRGMDRLAAALAAHYAYYRATRRMWTAAHRDAADVPALQGPMQAFSAHIAAIGAALADDLAPRPDRRKFLSATVVHALAFTTWEQLEALGLGDGDKAGLACAWARGAIAGEC